MNVILLFCLWTISEIMFDLDKSNVLLELNIKTLGSVSAQFGKGKGDASAVCILHEPLQAIFDPP